MKREVQTSRVKLPCPMCGAERVLDARDQTTAESITLYPSNKSDSAQLFAKCWKCGNQVGIAVSPEI